jgi:general secretion pathway protein K
MRSAEDIRRIVRTAAAARIARVGRTATSALAGHAGSERGVALLMVLWVFMVLTVLVGEFGRSMRDDAVATQNLAEEVQARGIAMAGINQAIYRALRSHETQTEATRHAQQQQQQKRGLETKEPEVWLADGKPHEAPYAGGKYTVRIFDEGGKISLNRADEALLRRVFASLGVERSEQEEIVDAILDWRDSDSLRRVHGAEEEYYAKLPEPYRPKNGAFDSVEELLLVKGISHDLFYGTQPAKFARDEKPAIPLTEVFSVFNRTANINIRSASPAVLRVLMQGEEEDVEAVIEARDADPASALKLLQAKIGDALLSRRVVDRAPTTVAIDARASMEHGHIQARVGAIIDFSEDGDGFHVARWIDRLPARGT